MANEQIRKLQDASRRAQQATEQIGKAGAAFLVADLDLAMTLVRIASDAGEDSGKRIRHQTNARRAYDEVSRISLHASLTDKERREVGNKLTELKTALQRLGEDFA